MRICIFSGACGGKTSTATWLFSELKRADYSVEYAHEYVKRWTYHDRKPRSFDQILIFGKQLNLEDNALSAGVKNIVTDSPISLSYIYGKAYSDPEMADHLLGLANLFEEKYPSVAIYLDRGEKKFKPEGRWGSLEDALVIDASIKEFLTDYYPPDKLLISNWNEKQRILDFALKYIDK